MDSLGSADKLATARRSYIASLAVHNVGRGALPLGPRRLDSGPVC